MEKKSVKNPWNDFASPPYDRRDGKFIPAGTNYGVGYRNPVGTKETSPLSKGPIPMQSKCYEDK